jgi:hypothetical protein
VSQRGDRVEVSCVAPRTTTDAGRLPVLDIELLRADREGDFEKTARGVKRKAAPGETLLESESAPPPGTVLRFAARAHAAGRSSALSPVLTLRVQAPPSPPTGFAAEVSPRGVSLRWDAPPPPSISSGPETPPPPTPTPPSAPAVRPRPALPPVATATPGATPAPAAPPASQAPASQQADPSAAGTPSPSTASPSPPTSGVWIYRRARDGAYGRPLTARPLGSAAYDDEAVQPGEAWCYVARTAVSTEPVVESAPSAEACVSVRDVAAPAAPLGVAVLAREGGLEVSWSPSPEPDLFAYRVYRAGPGAEPERVAEVPGGETSFRDTALSPGVAYAYAISAVDRAGNESAHSTRVEGSLPR